MGKRLWDLGERAREQFRRRHFGFVFQGFNLFPSLSAREQLEMVARWGDCATRREARRRVGEMLEQLGLFERSELRADLLSGGEKQRVAVGRALLKKPQFCFADEPTGSLDWMHGEQVIRLLRSAGRDSGAVLFLVGHDPRVLPYADRVLHLVDGRLSDEPVPTQTELRS